MSGLGTLLLGRMKILCHTRQPPGGFDSRSIQPKASWKYVANKPGTFCYICAFHPTMKATLIVKEPEVRGPHEAGWVASLCEMWMSALWLGKISGQRLSRPTAGAEPLGEEVT
jgi:hypothetical protein